MGLLVGNFDFGMTEMGTFFLWSLLCSLTSAFEGKLRVKRWSPSRIPESFLVSCPLFVILRGWGYSKGLIGVGTVGTGVYNTFDSSSKLSLPAMTTDLITMITTVGWWNWGSASGFGESLSQRSSVCPGVGKPLNDHLMAHRASCWVLFKMIFLWSPVYFQDYSLHYVPFVMVYPLFKIPGRITLGFPCLWMFSKDVFNKSILGQSLWISFFSAGTEKFGSCRWSLEGAKTSEECLQQVGCCGTKRHSKEL